MTNQNNDKSKNGKRIALILVALLLIAAIAFGAYTYSRYVSRGQGSDSATVAAWGFTATICGEGNNAFSQYYDSTGAASDNNDANAAAVAGVSGAVVAPGTSGSFEITIGGTAEVDADLAFELAATDDVFITLTDADATSTTIEYHPLRFKLEQYVGSNWQVVTTGSSPDTTTFENMSLADLSTAIETLSTKIETGTSANARYRLSWEWLEEVESESTLEIETYQFDATAINALDTTLAQLSYNSGSGTDVPISNSFVTDESSNDWNITHTTLDEHYSTEVEFTLTVTISQSPMTDSTGG